MTTRVSRGSTFKKFRGARNRLRRFIPGLFVLGKAISLTRSSRSYLVKAGYFESVRKKQPCRLDGSPLPWMNYSVIEFLELRLTNDLSLFEYGSGNSTIFFAERVAEVVSVEGDYEWYRSVKGRTPDNVRMIHFPTGDERIVNAIDIDGKNFDVVVVDAEDRVQCMLKATSHLTERGVILLDDAETREFQAGIDALLAQGFKELAFNGLKPGSVHKYRTSIFYRDGNCLGL